MAFGGFGGFSGFGAATRPVAQFPPLSEEEERDLLSRIMGFGQGLLQYAGETLDKPAAGVRGALVGDFSQLANWIPFSDSLGITNPSERVTGRDVLEEWDVVGRNNPDKWFEAGDIAGFGLSVLTDPLSFANPLGALTKGGHLAKSAGLLDDLPLLAKETAIKAGTEVPGKRAARSMHSLDDLIGYAKGRPGANVDEIDANVAAAAQGLGINPADVGSERLWGSLGFSAGPFARSIAPGGPVGQVSNYGKALDTVGGFLASGNPVGRGLQAGFRNVMQGQTNAIAQSELPLLARQKEVLQANDAKRMFDMVNELEKIVDITDEGVHDSLRAYAELGEDYLTRDLPNKKFGNPNLLPLPQRAKEIVEQIIKDEDTLYAQAKATGAIEGREFLSKFGTRHAYRQATQRTRGGKIIESPFQDLDKAFDASSRTLGPRSSVIGDFPGGRDAIERVMHDPELVGPAQLSVGRRTTKIREEFYGVPRTARSPIRGAKRAMREGQVKFNELPENVQEWLRLDQQARKVAKSLRKNAPVLEESERFYGKSLLKDDYTYRVAVQGVTQTANSIHRMFQESAKTITEIAGKNAEDYVHISEAYGKFANFKNPKQALSVFSKNTSGKFGTKADELDAFVPKGVAEAAGAVLTKFQQPQEVKAMMDVFDRWVTNLWKFGMTAAPGFHFRNFFSGQWQNFMTGAYSNVGEAGKALRVAHQFSSGQVIKGLADEPAIKRLFPDVASDAEATRRFTELVHTYKLRESGIGDLAGGVDEMGEAIPESAHASIFGEFPNEVGRKRSLLDWSETSSIPRRAWQQFMKQPGAKEKFFSITSPNRVSGIGKGVTPAGEGNVLAAAHRDAGQYIEDLARVGPFLTKMNKGMSPAEAAKQVKLAHVNYQNLSNFEKAYLRRAAPFYSFTKGMVTHIADTMASHPGGRLSQFIRLSNAGREGGAWQPEYVGEGLAVPLNEERSKYLARVGLMHEAPFDLAAFRFNPEGRLDLRQTAERTLQKVGSMLNPAFKLPIELMTDTQLYTGRPFSELYPFPVKPGPTLGSDLPILANALLGSSPASRAIRTGRTAIDERKSVPERLANIFTGLAVTDISDVERAKELDAARAADRILSSSPNIKEFSTLYAPEAMRGNLTPTERALLRLKSTQRAKAKEAALSE